MEGEKTAVVAEEEAVAEVVGGGEGSVGRCLAAKTYFVEEAIFAAHQFDGVRRLDFVGRCDSFCTEASVEPCGETVGNVTFVADEGWKFKLFRKTVFDCGMVQLARIAWKTVEFLGNRTADSVEMRG